MERGLRRELCRVTAATLKIRGGGCEVDSYGKRAGKGALIQWELSGTLGVSQDQTLFVWCTPLPIEEEKTGAM